MKENTNPYDIVAMRNKKNIIKPKNDYSNINPDKISFMKTHKEAVDRTTNIEENNFPTQQAIQMQALVIQKTAGALLPCPFCGRKAKYVVRERKKNTPKLFSVRCSNYDCEYTTTGFLYQKKKDATESWNKRAGREPQSK